MTQSKFILLRVCPATNLARGFTDLILNSDGIANINRHYELESVAQLGTYGGGTYLTTHNFDELVEALGAAKPKQGGERLEEKLLKGAQAQIDKANELKREAEKLQLYLNAKGEVVEFEEVARRIMAGERAPDDWTESNVLSLDEARERVKAEVGAVIGGDSDADAGTEV